MSLPTTEKFSKALSLALGSDTSMLYYPSAPATGDYIITTTTDAIPADSLITTTSSSTFDFTISADSLPPSTIMLGEKTIDDIVAEKIEQYKELMRLQALGCKNCGGTIDKDTMTCEYCGTRYRN